MHVDMNLQLSFVMSLSGNGDHFNSRFSHLGLFAFFLTLFSVESSLPDDIVLSAAGSLYSEVLFFHFIPFILFQGKKFVNTTVLTNVATIYYTVCRNSTDFNKL